MLPPDVRLKEIRARGYEFAVVETGDMSRSIVPKHGFQHLTTVWDYQWRGNLQEAVAGVPAGEALAWEARVK